MKPLAITMGDPAGIGPEIIARAFAEHPDAMRDCFVVGDVACMRRANALVCADGHPVLPIAVWGTPPGAQDAVPRSMPVVPVHLPVPHPEHTSTPVVMGQVSALAGAMAGHSVLQATQYALQGVVSAVVTAPLHKEALHAAGAPFDVFPGHTEMLQDAAARHLQAPVPVRMMLANDELRTVLVSIHVSLRQAIEAVQFENVFQTIQIASAALGKLLGRAPRIAVAGLNPHAGEGGLFGSEEQTIIIPAIEKARAFGCDVQGPFPPDTIFMRARKREGIPAEFDVVVAMYHDQGLIPVKYLGVEQGVNVTLGLPFVRTSPDHGTAFDIAGTGRASAASFLAAVRMARQLLTS
jgi:4-hydroxythreonine-4-phosphate dehydrogenase